MRYAYPCILTPEVEGGFFVQFPGVPGALTGGKDRDETLDLAEDALVVALTGYIIEGWDIPVPGPVADGQDLVIIPPVPAAKLSLYTAMREQGITPVALAETLGITEAAVRKLITPDDYYDSDIDAVMRALRAVGRNLVVEDLAA